MWPRQGARLRFSVTCPQCSIVLLVRVGRATRANRPRIVPRLCHRRHPFLTMTVLRRARGSTSYDATHCHLGDGPSKAFLEIFAGSACLTAACLDQGMLAYAIDHIRYKHARGPVISLDLTSLEHQEILLRWIASGVVGAVALAPPCGTASGQEKSQVDHHRCERTITRMACRGCQGSVHPESLVQIPCMLSVLGLSRQRSSRVCLG